MISYTTHYKLFNVCFNNDIKEFCITNKQGLIKVAGFKTANDAIGFGIKLQNERLANG